MEEKWKKDKLMIMQKISKTKIYVQKENNRIILITLTLLFFGKELIVLLYMLLQIF